MPHGRARQLFFLTAWFCLLFAGLFAGWLPAASAQALSPVPRLATRVTDQTGTLSPAQRGQLEAKLASLERRKGAQLAVLLVPSVKPETIEQYALRAAEAWKLGRKGVDDGALLVVARDDRKLHIEVGYGLEGALNDATARRIASETISPRFKQGDFAGGIEAGVDAMIRVVDGEALPPPAPIRALADAGLDAETWIALAFVFVFVIGGILRALFGRFLASLLLGGAAGFIASLFIASLFFSGLIGFAAFVASLLAGSSAGAGRHRGGSSWSSGSWSSGSGGSSDSGSFSGGGGDFGGGGASGDW